MPEGHINFFVHRFMHMADVQKHKREYREGGEQIFPYPPDLNRNEIIQELENLKVHPRGIALMAPKFISFPVKVKQIDPRGANILKQEMLALGGDAAVPEDVFSFSGTPVDVILIGTEKHYASLVKKLEYQPFGLKKIGKGLEEVLRRSVRVPEELRIGDRRYQYRERTLIMGVLNVTPDSFSDGGKFSDPEEAVSHALAMEEEGAHIIDIGGESTRPGSSGVSAAEEKDRVLPVISGIRAHSSVPLSIDTTKADVARAALEAGANMVNDISGFHFDPDLVRVVSDFKVPCVVMHTRGRPKTMQEDTGYEDLFHEILTCLRESILTALEKGIPKENIIVDPGIGFGKSAADNLKLLQKLRIFRSLGYPILVGPSRKSFLGKVLNAGVDGRLEGTAASVALAVWNGASMIRVHDVEEMKRVILVADAIKRGSFEES